MASIADVYHVVKSFIRNSAADLFASAHPQGYIRQWLQMNYRWIDRYPAIPTKELAELLPGARDVVITMDVQYNAWNITPLELYLLSCMAIIRKPKRIFEIGTYDGATTLQLAKCCPDSQIFTIDLCPQPEEHFIVGSRFFKTPYEKQIVQLYGDSTQFDYSPYREQMDLIFVDGEHEYEIVRSDTTNALKMVSPHGMIVWDDYLNWRGVKCAVEELRPHYPIFHLADTKFAVLIR